MTKHDIGKYISDSSSKGGFLSSKVLIGEDEAIIAMDLELILTELGYSVVGIGSSGDQIINMNRKLKPDIVLMDIRLSGPLSGFQTAKEIQKEHDVPILFITAASEDVIIKNLKRWAFLHKPFTKEELEEALGNLQRQKKR